MPTTDFFKKNLEDTYEFRADHIDNHLTPLWDFVDYCIDDAARDPIFVEFDDIMQSILEFCLYKAIEKEEIPSLYQYIFETTGFLQRAKIPYYIRHLWTERFPEDTAHSYILNRTLYDDATLPMILLELKCFLEESSESDNYVLTLQFLERFMEELTTHTK